MYLGIETGGTKIIARVVDADGATLAQDRWATGTADEAADAIVGLAQSTRQTIASAGMAAFGPLIVDPESRDYGRMLETNKPGWTGTNLRAMLSERLGCPVAVDSDVNVAAIAEQALGAGKGLRSVAYVTVGTGVGAGLAINGHALVGALHPEAGHVRMIRAPGDTMPSACQFHDDCIEGLAAGPALGRRLSDGNKLADQPDVAKLVAGYLGQLLATIVLMWTPQRIVVGGGIMSTPGLLGDATVAMRDVLGGYGVGPVALTDDFVKPATLQDAGLEGALLMARR